MSPVNLYGQVVVVPNVIARDLGGETVLLNLKTGTYFGLDSVGARLWSLIQSGSTIAAMSDALASEFDAEPSVIESDIKRLLTDMAAQGLVSLPE